MAPYSSTLAWKIPWTEEPGRLQTIGSRRVGHDWATSLSLFPFMNWRRKWPPTPVFLPGESQGQGAWWAAVYGVAQSRTRLKRLSSSTKKPRKTPKQGEESKEICDFTLYSCDCGIILRTRKLKIYKWIFSSTCLVLVILAQGSNPHLSLLHWQAGSFTIRTTWEASFQ